MRLPADRRAIATGIGASGQQAALRIDRDAMATTHLGRPILQNV
jgi:hypothetical protein